jgi:hypothetical protein
MYDWFKAESFRRELKRQRDAIIEGALDSLKSNIALELEFLRGADEIHRSESRC